MPEASTDQILRIARARLVPSPTNPRTHFDEAKLAELRASIHTRGIQMPLIVRRVEIDSHQEEMGAPDEMYEIVAGERRFRASGEGPLPDGSTAPALETLPCLVRELSDVEALEIQALENLQREDLTPIEEARCYQQMLGITLDDATLAPVYTIASLAEKLGVGVDKISYALALLELPRDLQREVEDGTLPPSVGRLIGRLPGEETKREAARLILHPELQAGPLTFKQASELIATRFTVSLRGAPFSLDDATLLHDAGACTACPHYHGGGAARSGGKGGGMCQKPSCFQEKVELEWERWQISEQGEDRLPMTSEGSSKAFLPGSRFVRADDLPTPDLVRGELLGGRGAVKKWRELVKGQKIIVQVARDEGKTVEMYDREVAMEAAKLNGHDIFNHVAGEPAKRPRTAMPAEEAKDNYAREQAARAKAVADTEAVAQAVFVELMDTAKAGMKIEQHAEIIRMLLFQHLSEEDRDAVLDRRGWKNEKQAEAGIAALPGDKLKVLLLEMALGVMVDPYTGAMLPMVEPLAKAFGVPFRKIEREVRKNIERRERKPEEKSDGELVEELVADAIIKHVASVSDPETGETVKLHNGALIDDSAIEAVIIAVGSAGITIGEMARKLKCPESAIVEWYKDKGMMLDWVYAREGRKCGPTFFRSKRHDANVKPKAKKKLDSKANVKALAKAVKSAKPAKEPTKAKIGASIIAQLKAAGKSGVTVKELAAGAGAKPGNVFAWFYVTGKKVRNEDNVLAIRKVGEAKYAWTPAEGKK